MEKLQKNRKIDRKRLFLSKIQFLFLFFCIPGPTNPIPEKHRRAHIDHPSQFSHHPGVTDSRHFRGHSPQFGYNQGYSRGYDNYHHGYYPPQHHYDRYNQGPPRGYYDAPPHHHHPHHHEMGYGRQSYGNKMMPYHGDEHVQPAGPPTVQLEEKTSCNNKQF